MWTRLLNLSDQMKVVLFRIPSDPVAWGDAVDLEPRLASLLSPSELWLASTGLQPPEAMKE